MKLEDCKTIEVENNLRKKVQVEIYSKYFSSNYIMKIRLTGEEYGQNEDQIKGDYCLIRLAFDAYSKKDAENFVKSVSNRKG